jgi:hypothetical protein
MSDRIATTEVWLEGFYWVILGQNPPEIACAMSPTDGSNREDGP